MSSLTRTFVLAIAIAVPTSGAFAQQKIVIGATPNTGPAAAMVADVEGIFLKHGLQSTYTLIPINPSIPPALLSGSLQFGTPTATTYLQAVDGGLDLVVVAGTSNTGKSVPLPIIARKDSGIKEAKDLVGKKVGAPGLNALLHVMARHWLIEKGVDPKTVNFVEASFPVHGDMLRGGQIDAVVSVDPFAAGILARGDGVAFVDLAADFPEGYPTQMFTSTRDYATKNPGVIAAFRAAIEEGAAFIKANPDKARDDVGKMLKLPAPVIATLQIGLIDPKITKEQLAFWIDVMKKQNMLSREIDPGKLILN